MQNKLCYKKFLMKTLIIQMRITYLKLKKKTDFLWIYKKNIKILIEKKEKRLHWLLLANG